MAATEKVLVIDDDKFIRKVLIKALSDHYDTLTAESGPQGLEQVLAQKPDFILLDIEMPGMNGYEVCDKLKQDSATKDTPVIFLSGHSSLRERMLGYEMGGADFIVKPCNTEELLAKLQVLSDARHSKHQLSQKAEVAARTAFTAMRGSSELGLAIQFIEATYNINNIDAVAKKFLEVTTSIGLNCSLMFHIRTGYQYFTARSDDISPLESELMATLFERGQRFNDFGCRTQINYPRVALLVKNMPLSDPEAYGRYKDFLPTMLGSTDSKAKAIDTEMALREQTMQIKHSFSVVQKTLMQVGDQLQENQADVLRLLREMTAELEERIPKLGLEEDQEKYFLSRVDSTIDATQTIINSSESAKKAFGTVGRLLDFLSDKQYRLMDDLVGKDKPISAADDTQVTGDVELF